VAARPCPAADAVPSSDAKAGEPTETRLDPRILLLLHEAFRHSKALGCWGVGAEAVADAGILPEEVGVVTGSDGSEVWNQVHELMAQHRAWERFGPALPSSD